MTNWVNTVSRDHVLRGVAGGFTQANHGKPHMLRRMARGDWIVFYSPRTALQDGEPLQQFTALGRVVDDEVHQVEMGPDFHPFRRNVEFLRAEPAPIRPLLESLDFVADLAHWGYLFRRGVFEIGAADLGRIAAAMGVAIPVG